MMWHKPAKWLDSHKTKNVGIQTNTKLTYQEIIEEMLMMGSRLSKRYTSFYIRAEIKHEIEEYFRYK